MAFMLDKHRIVSLDCPAEDIRLLPVHDTRCRVFRHRERLQNALRDYFGTFGAAGCISVLLRSLRVGVRPAGASRNLAIFKGFVGRSAENLTRTDHFGELVRTPPR
jgi:hypothetical protein